MGMFAPLTRGAPVRKSDRFCPFTIQIADEAERFPLPMRRKKFLTIGAREPGNRV
jgi:hypothetical protein